MARQNNTKTQSPATDKALAWKKKQQQKTAQIQSRDLHPWYSGIIRSCFKGNNTFCIKNFKWAFTCVYVFSW